MTPIMFVVLLLALLQGSAPAAAPTQSPEEEIRAVLKAQVAAWNRGDVSGFMQGYWRSPETEFVTSDGILRGWQRVLARYRKAYPNRSAMGRLEFSDLEVTELGPDAALVVGNWRLKRASEQLGGVFTLVFKKFPEGWRIINDHTSQTPNP
jgi:uncharacterized protein (TIGR02246 family)